MEDIKEIGQLKKKFLHIGSIVYLKTCEDFKENILISEGFITKNVFLNDFKQN